MTNEELLNRLINLQLGITAIDSALVGLENETHLPPDLPRINRMHRNLRKASANLITTTTIAQQWIYYTGGLQPPSEA
jgi:hypothetical protein